MICSKDFSRMRAAHGSRPHSLEHGRVWSLRGFGSKASAVAGIRHRYSRSWSERGHARSWTCCTHVRSATCASPRICAKGNVESPPFNSSCCERPVAQVASDCWTKSSALKSSSRQ